MERVEKRKTDKKQQPPLRHELLDFIRDNSKLADAHAAFIAAGGDRALDLAVHAVRGDMFPWDQPQHVQASFGAFTAGAEWMARLIRQLVVLANNRSEALRTLAQTDGRLSAEERELLKRLYGYTEADLAAADNQQSKK
jgi:hypothetical protein